MPQRFLRPGITTSKHWNRCDWFTQSFYARLITLVDDYGRYEAEPELLRSLAFPFGDPDGNPIPLTEILSGLRTIVSQNLAETYEVEGKQYLQLTRWQERKRSDSKHPAPPKEISCQQLTATDSKCSLPKSSSSPPSSPAPASKPTPTPSTRERASVCQQGKISEQKVKFELDARVDWLGAELSKLYRRPCEIKPKFEEQSALAEVVRRADVKSELTELVQYRERLPDKRYFPQSMMRLLQAWDETLDSARGNLFNGALSGAELVVRQKEYDRVCASMMRIRTNYGDHQTWSGTDSREFGRLKTRKQQLKQMLGLTV